MKLVALALLVSLSYACSATVPVNVTSEPISRRTPIVIPTPTPDDEIVVPDIPKATWQPIFHESIDSWTRSVHVARLRDESLDANDIEVRVWGGFGLIPPTGFVLKRDGGEWSGFYVKRLDATRFEKVPLAKPDVGWTRAWQSLLQHQILALPDARSIKCEPMLNDGYSYVVEIKKGPSYRTYMYENPWYDFKNRCKQADEILAIASIITDTYKVPHFRVDD